LHKKSQIPPTSETVSEIALRKSGSMYWRQNGDRWRDPYQHRSKHFSHKVVTQKGSLLANCLL
jgi:hypothetical protein